MPTFKLAGKPGHIYCPAGTILRAEPGPGLLTTMLFILAPPGTPGCLAVEIEGTVEMNGPVIEEAGKSTAVKSSLVTA